MSHEEGKILIITLIGKILTSDFQGELGSEVYSCDGFADGGDVDDVH